MHNIKIDFTGTGCGDVADLGLLRIESGGEFL